jgi:hypothetical protein
VNIGSVNSENKQKLGLYGMAIGLAVIIFVGGYLILVKPSAAKASFLATRVTHLNQEAANASTTYAQAQQLSQVQLADLFDLTRAMPDNPQIADILVVLGRLAANSNVQFNSIKPAVVVPLAGYQAQPMQIELQGNFYDLMEFLYQLRHLVDVRTNAQGTAKLYATGRLFTVNKIDIAIVTTGDLNKPQLTATIDLDAFVYGTAATPSTAAPVTTTTATTTTPAASAAAPPAGGTH